MLQKIRNIIFGTISNIFGKNKELYKKRKLICDSCPHKIKMAGSETCGICYCFLSSKLRVPEEYCLDGRWDAENETK